MCGICGYFSNGVDGPRQRSTLDAMLSRQVHRGPDGFGVFEASGIGLGHARLSIIGLDNGKQPIPNEDESVWIALNGEIFNYQELREQLQARGHKFRTQSDSEVVVHLYEEHGMDFMDQINGQFSFALWDAKKRELILCRDRHGILPLFYTRVGGNLVFSSEIKAFHAYPGFRAELDCESLDQIFTFWTLLAPRTALKNVYQIKPGCYLRFSGDQVAETQYWDMQFLAEGEVPQFSEQEAYEKLRSLLEDAVDLRRQADVPVGCYLSGGLDSSAVTTIAAQQMGHAPEAFSIRFEDPNYDEGRYQDLVSKKLGVNASCVTFTAEDLIRWLPTAVRHAEQPVLRTGMVPMMLLSKHVRESNFKAVLAGVGADEFFVGYNIFKEAKVRRFWSRGPDSEWRPSLLKKLYPYLTVNEQGAGYWKSFFGQGLTETRDPLYSHRRRWTSTSRVKRFFSADLRSQISSYDAYEELESQLPDAYSSWNKTGQAQYLEATLFLSNYLLNSQGDRMAMANAVEVRYPFLDHRVVEFCNALPATWKMRGLNEKRMLKRAMEKRLPDEVVRRAKQPYRAPAVAHHKGDVIWEALSPESINKTGLFDAKLIELLRKKLTTNSTVWSEADQMTLNGVLTTQLFHSEFIEQEEESLV